MAGLINSLTTNRHSHIVEKNLFLFAASELLFRGHQIGFIFTAEAENRTQWKVCFSASIEALKTAVIFIPVTTTKTSTEAAVWSDRGTFRGRPCESFCARRLPRAIRWWAFSRWFERPGSWICRLVVVVVVARFWPRWTPRTSWWRPRDGNKRSRCSATSLYTSPWGPPDLGRRPWGWSCSARRGSCRR